MPNQDNWKLYYQKTSQNPPRETLIRALDSFKKEGVFGKAFDLGSGACNDVRYLLNEGWEVTAVDNEPKAQEFFQVEFAANPKAHFQLCSFEKVKWHNAHLIHAGFALAFCPHDSFHEVIKSIQDYICVGGRFAGNFFGPEHSWDDLSLISKAELEKIFQHFEVEWMVESKETRLSTLGEEIFHHNISLIAKKLG